MQFTLCSIIYPCFTCTVQLHRTNRYQVKLCSYIFEHFQVLQFGYNLFNGYCLTCPGCFAGFLYRDIRIQVSQHLVDELNCVANLNLSEVTIALDQLFVFTFLQICKFCLLALPDFSNQTDMLWHHVKSCNKIHCFCLCLTFSDEFIKYSFKFTSGIFCFVPENVLNVWASCLNHNRFFLCTTGSTYFFFFGGGVCLQKASNLILKFCFFYLSSF